ncbi:STAS domain-containing protein [Pseudaeromonas sp. ZJS20]|uniref:STAS domain-containing protein n=1 Tax=Pseudaeromonas aegiceratis TaxID=3153928 RepID=UPI00390C8D9A
MLDIAFNQEGSALQLMGALTIYEVGQLQSLLNQPQPPLTALTVDLGAVEELDTAGVQLLMAMRQWLGEALILINHSPAVIEMFDLYQLVPFFGDDIVLSHH